MYMTNLGLCTVSINWSIPPPSEDVIGFSNNINIHVQENSGNDAGGLSGGNGEMYSDSTISQGQSTKQDSSVVS
jgi:hypothetical protein